MTKDEMLKERDRLATELQIRFDQELYKEGFNDALKIVERERVKPLRDAFNKILQEHVSISLWKEIAKQALAQVEEWK